MRVSCTVLPCSQVPPQLAQRVTAQFEAIRVMHQVIQDAVAAAQQPAVGEIVAQVVDSHILDPGGLTPSAGHSRSS